MKKMIFTLVAFAIGISSFGQSNFETAMAEALKQFGESKTPEAMTVVSNSFERIAAAEPGQWLPLYYVSIIQCDLSFRTNDPNQKQKLIDYAQLKLDAAMKIAPEESELHTLQGMIYQAVLTIDPMNNGMVYGPKASGSFQKAIALNARNPRPYYLQGISLIYTPEQYGGGKKAALSLFAKAKELYETFAPKSALYPNWGKEECLKYYEDCQSN